MHVTRVRSPRPFCLALLGLLLAAAPAARAAEVTIFVSNTFFAPDSVTIQPGDTVTWQNTEGAHNVRADDGSFRCANGCDGAGGGNGDIAGNLWSFSRTFNQPGTIRYHCQAHGGVGFGMRGEIVVQAGGNDEPGALRFSQGNFNVNEGGGTATITVNRVGGDDGAVSVAYSATSGSATAGADFTAVSGTLSWLSGNDDDMTFAVPIFNDATDESNETVVLTLSDPTGGADLANPSTATLTINDNDASPTPTPGSEQFGSGSFSGAEGTAAAITVTRTGGTSGAVGVSYATGAGGSATGGADYTPAAGTITFAGGEGGSKSFQVALAADAEAEGNETVSLTLSAPTGGATLGSPAAATLVILDQAESGPGLTEADVLCDAARLSGLLDRAVVTAPGTSKGTGLNLSFTGTGDFAGIAHTGNGPGTPEHHLAFSTNPEETTLLRNPDRPQLFSVSLSRNQLNSDLVGGNDADRLVLTLNPTLDPNASGNALLAIDNVEAPAGRPADAKPGRGLGSLVSPCHDKFTARDVHVFRVLAKTARAESDLSSRFKLAIFRGAADDTYRVDVYPIGPGGAPLGRLAVEVQATFGGAGELVGGTLRILPRCSAAQSTNCTNVNDTGFSLVEPTNTGGFWPATPYRVFTESTNGSGQPEHAIDWSDLLAGTSWARPL